MGPHGLFKMIARYTLNGLEQEHRHSAIFSAKDDVELGIKSGTFINEALADTDYDPTEPVRFELLRINVVEKPVGAK